MVIIKYIKNEYNWIQPQNGRKTKVKRKKSEREKAKKIEKNEKKYFSSRTGMQKHKKYDHHLCMDRQGNGFQFDSKVWGEVGEWKSILYALTTDACKAKHR